MELRLTLPLPTSINALYINQAKYNPKTKKYEPTGQRILSKEGVHSKQLIAKATKQQMKKQIWDFEYTKENYIYMDTVIYFNRKGRDDNNIYKLLCDTLEGIVYDNDSRVLIRTQRVLYDTDNPRVEVHIHPVDYIGIFDDQKALDDFESVCKDCKRYGRNCSILKAAKEGRIQEEIVNGVCAKYETKKTATK
jgi:Holliday junction resolvase RusA-like endonuclease